MAEVSALLGSLRSGISGELERATGRRVPMLHKRNS